LQPLQAYPVVLNLVCHLICMFAAQFMCRSVSPQSNTEVARYQQRRLGKKATFLFKLVSVRAAITVAHGLCIIGG